MITENEILIKKNFEIFIKNAKKLIITQKKKNAEVIVNFKHEIETHDTFFTYNTLNDNGYIQRKKLDYKQIKEISKCC